MLSFLSYAVVQDIYSFLTAKSTIIWDNTTHADAKEKFDNSLQRLQQTVADRKGYDWACLECVDNFVDLITLNTVATAESKEISTFVSEHDIHTIDQLSEAFHRVETSLASSAGFYNTGLMSKFNGAYHTFLVWATRNLQLDEKTTRQQALDCKHLVEGETIRPFCNYQWTVWTHFVREMFMIYRAFAEASKVFTQSSSIRYVKQPSGRLTRASTEKLVAKFVTEDVKPAPAEFNADWARKLTQEALAKEEQDRVGKLIAQFKAAITEAAGQGKSMVPVPDDIPNSTWMGVASFFIATKFSVTQTSISW